MKKLFRHRSSQMILAFLFIFNIHINHDLVVEAQETIEFSDIGITAYPKEATYNDNIVITIDMPDEMQAAKVMIDLTEVGGPAEMKINPSLMEHTISIKDSTTTGVKALPIHIQDETGENFTTEVEIKVIKRELESELDFDWDEAVIYFMLTDRFDDGDPSNNNPNGENYDTEHSETYHGGDFQGIIDRLDYLEELGINTIWITPIDRWM